MISKVQDFGKGLVSKLHGGNYERLKRWMSRAQIVIIPLGVAALCYWASQESSIRFSDSWNAYLLFGVLISQISIYFFALRFCRVMKIIGLSLSVIDSLRINTLAMFYHFFVPLSIGAEITKFVKLRVVAPDHRPLVTAGAIVIDHIVGFIALITILIGLIPTLKSIAIEFDLRVPIVVVGLTTLIGALVVSRSRMSRSVKVLEVLGRLRGHKLDVLYAFGWSLVAQLLIAAAVFAASYGWGIQISYLEILFVLTGAFIFQGIPISLVGIGVAEIAGTGLYMVFGLPVSDAVLLVSLMYCYRILMALIGGVWELISAKNVGG